MLPNLGPSLVLTVWAAVSWSDISLHVVQKRLSEEYERCQNYLDASTRKPLISAVEEQLLSKHMAAM